MAIVAKLSLLALVIGLSASVARSQESVNDLLEGGDKARELGQLERARKLFEEARLKARQIGNRGEEVQAILGLLRTEETRIQSDPESEKSDAEIKQVTELEQAAIEMGDPLQSQSAINILGVIYLRLRMAKNALETMERLDLERVDQSERFIYEYNLGRVFEANDRPGYAFKLYLEAIRRQPEFQPAIEAAFRLMQQPELVSAASAFDLCAALLDGNRAAASDRCVAQALPEWAGKEGSEPLLELLVRRYTSFPVTREDFEKSERMRLQPLAERGEYWKSAIEEIWKAYEGEFPAPLDPQEAKNLFPRWSGDPRRSKTFSRLLLTVGESLEQGILTGRLKSSPAHIRQALAYYMAAWGLDRGNVRPALRAALVLYDYPDLEMREKFLTSLINDTQAKASGTQEEKESWRDSSQFRETIGNILSESGGCGSEKDPQAAFYHWQRAFEIERQGEEHRDFSEWPELNRHLADCYRKSGDMEAFRRFDDGVRESLRKYRPLSPVEDKLHYHLRAMVYPGGLLKSIVQAGLLLALNTPENWGQGPAGFGRRLASSHGTRAVRHALAFGIDSALHEDPHYIPAPHRQTGARFWFAVKQTLVCRSDRLNSRFATWRVGSAYAAEFISNMWRPRGSGLGNDNIRGAFLRGSFALAGDTASNVLREFLPYRGRWAKILGPFLNR